MMMILFDDCGDGDNDDVCDYHALGMIMMMLIMMVAGVVVVVVVMVAV